MAPPYANIFLITLETEILAKSPYKPKIWLRHVDDIFMIWHHEIDNLASFLGLLSSHHSTIKFTHDASATSVSSLDVHVSISDDRILETDLYCKSTDSHQYLLNSSCHPGNVERSLPFSRA